MDRPYDAIVVGAGGSGLAASLSIAQAGGRVLLLEKRPQPGGTTGIAVGSFTAAGTSLQRQAGIAHDDPLNHAADVARFAPADIEGRNDEPLRRFLLCHAAETFEWLRSLGLSFHGPSPEPPNRVPRMHNVVPGARAYIATLQLALRQSGGTMICDATVEHLLRHGQRVVGVQARVADRQTEFRARRGVILAAGDYANDPRLIAEHKGEQFAAIEGINPHATGDGHRLAAGVGAELINMDVTYGPELRFVTSNKSPFPTWLPVGGRMGRWLGALVDRLPKFVLQAYIKRLLVTWQHPENALFDDGAILINARGERFTNERSWPEREIAVARQPDKVAYLLLDRRLIDRYSAWPHFISTAPDIAYAYVKDYERLRPDVTIVDAKLERLAARRAIPAEAMARTVEQFNRYASGEERDRFGRCDDCHPLSGNRWALLGPVKAYFTTTEGGARIDHRFRVLDSGGQPIPGLFAVGQNGLGGQILWGHGLHIAWALTSGRLAGREVMQETDEASQPETLL